LITAKYPKSSRLLSKKDFEEMKAGSIRHQKGLFLAFTKNSNYPTFRLGLSVHRSAGHSPDRNLLKRLTRESFRKRLGLPSGKAKSQDILIVYKSPIRHKDSLVAVLDKFFLELIS
jgi:ribonuclease P protein component